MAGLGPGSVVVVLEADVVLRALLVRLVEGAGYTALPLETGGEALPALPAPLTAIVADLDAPVAPPAATLVVPALLLSSREEPAPWPGRAAEGLAKPLVVAEFLAALRRVAGPP